MYTEHVCLYCGRLISIRIEDATHRICSNCRSRIIVDFDTLIRLVRGAVDWIESGNDPLPILSGLTVVLDNLPDIAAVLRKAAFPTGIEALNNILEIARSYEPDRINLEDHIYLYLKKLEANR